MNKKKIIFLTILGFFILVVVLIVSLMWWKDDNNNEKLNQPNNLVIWILDDSVNNFSTIIDEYKNISWNKNFTATVESFSNYSEYNKALSSAIIQWKAPDLYMLNNNEKSVFLENATWIDPSIISADELREYFRWFFWTDLILSSWEWEDKTEFLVWIPFWFETLWLYYNAKRVNDLKKLENFQTIEQVITDFKENKPGYTALWIWRGTTVVNSEDIISQFIMWSWIKNVWNLNGSKINTSLSEYFNYSGGDNNYIRNESILKKSSRTNLDYFVDGKIAMIFGYPRLLNEISELWFPKATLRVTNFPEFVNDSEKLVNYNYFVLNKNSENIDWAYSFLKFIFSEEWEKTYLKAYKHYLPARISLYSDLKDEIINDAFFIKKKHFYNSEAIYSSFDKWLKEVYDQKIKLLLDEEANYLWRMELLVSSLRCKVWKIVKLENLSQPCE